VDRGHLLNYSAEFLVGLYRTMVRIRLCEESFVEPILRRDVLCPVHLYSGQEAIAAGVCAALKPRDYVFGNHRSHGHYLAKGGSLKAMVAEIYCREPGCSLGRGGSMHLVAPKQGMLGAAPIVAGTISLALGSALASAIRRDRRVAVSFFGDGATGEGVFYESLNFAALRSLPIIFVCENNLYATHMPIRACRPQVSIHKIAVPFGIAGRRVDGNDVLAVYEAARAAAERCRKGGGPSFIECMTYRLRGHVGPDDNIQGTHTDIRPRTEVARWRKRDPIPRFERLLLRTRTANRALLDRIGRRAGQEVQAAHRFAREASLPRGEEFGRHVFAD
jgi:acetoin:2,6-dichlorophenolindophenol oxidoreductase subunit alpha